MSSERHVEMARGRDISDLTKLTQRKKDGKKRQETTQKRRFYAFSSSSIISFCFHTLSFEALKILLVNGTRYTTS